MNSDTVNKFDRKEELAHFYTHMVGVLFILVCAPWLIMKTYEDQYFRSGAIIYSITFLLVFLSSSIYHYLKSTRIKRTFKLVDHICIFLFIAGTNAIFLLGFGDQYYSLIYLGILIMLVVIGIVNQISDFIKNDIVLLTYYLLLGWYGLGTILLLYNQLQMNTILLVLAGGLSYSLGAYFYRYDERRWFHTVWHLFVLGGAFLHFAAIAYQIQSL